MSLKKFLLSGAFIKQLILAGIIVIVLLALTLQGIKLYTRHGQSFPVPNFSGLNQTEIEETAKKYTLKFEIIDSVHVNNVLPGVVVDQVPKANFKVKENRTIFLTINSVLAEQVTLPKLTDVSFRQAQVLIENCGLKTGIISYQPSEYNDLVLKALVDSTEIFTGEQLPKGSFVNLVIGRDSGKETTSLPNLAGLTIEEAKIALTNALLNSGVLIYDETVLSLKDSTIARVWKQHPNSRTTESVNIGTSVDLWITIDKQKIDEAQETEL